MKKTLFAAFIVAAFSQVKAQQYFNIKPSDSLKNNLFKQYFKLQPQSQLSLNSPQLNLNAMLASAGSRVKISPYDHMPIALLRGDSKMPVAKLGGSYKMPVLKLGEDPVVVLPDLKKQAP